MSDRERLRELIFGALPASLVNNLKDPLSGWIADRLLANGVTLDPSVDVAGLRAALERLVEVSAQMPNGYHVCRWCGVADDHAENCQWVRHTRELTEAKAEARAALATTAPPPAKEPLPDAKRLLAQRNDLFWYALMLRQGGPDGSELDQAVTEDGDAVIAAVGAELDAWDRPPAPTATLGSQSEAKPPEDVEETL